MLLDNLTEPSSSLKKSVHLRVPAAACYRTLDVIPIKARNVPFTCSRCSSWEVFPENNVNVCSGREVTFFNGVRHVKSASEIGSLNCMSVYRASCVFTQGLLLVSYFPRLRLFRKKTRTFVLDIDRNKACTTCRWDVPYVGIVCEAGKLCFNHPADRSYRHPDRVCLLSDGLDGTSRTAVGFVRCSVRGQLVDNPCINQHACRRCSGC
jgi:hypothetical protein